MTEDIANKMNTYLANGDSFVVLSVNEYEDLVMAADPNFKQAVQESTNDIVEGNLKPFSDVVRGLYVHDKT